MTVKTLDSSLLMRLLLVRIYLFLLFKTKKKLNPNLQCEEKY